MPAHGVTPEVPALDESLVAFLVRFSVALHKHSTYPGGHPTRQAADDAVVQALDGLFAARAELRLGVARHALVIGEASTEAGHPVLRELAERLHRRSVGGLVFRRGLGAEELGEALHELSGDPHHLRDRLLGLAEPLPEWPHLEVVPLAFRRLALAGDENGAGAEGAGEGGRRLWVQLAAATLEGDGDGEASPDAIARALNARAATAEGAAEAGRLLLRMGRAARGATGAERGALDDRLRAVLRGLTPDAMAALFGGDDPLRQRERIDEAVESLPDDGVVALLESAARAQGQQISHYLLRLLRKLSQQAAAGGDAGAAGDAALRQAARELVDQWTLDNPNPEMHTALLDALSRREGLTGADGAPAPSEARRLVQIALETDAAGENLLEAVEHLVAERRVVPLLALLDGAPDAPHAVGAVRAHLVSPELLRQVLLEEPVDVAGAQQVLALTGPEHAMGLIDVLAISEAQATRRLVLERLAALGDDIGPALCARIPTSPWYLQRNLLALVARLPRPPRGYSARALAEHAEVTVRYQALHVMARTPEDREEAIQLALADADPRVVRFGLDAAAAGLPKGALPRLMQLLNTPQKPLELRVRGIALLAQAVQPSVRDWLLERVVTKRTLLRGPRLVPKHPEMVAALAVLARRWKDSQQAAAALELARESGDPELVAAARGQAPA
jgi:hypothetical protein